ncbi:hypothetical protein [Mycobacterium aquaticum]|uniref:PASTA domain-containing protein n=1 Tax=Mycobacterium aquaticum TaxID=1927124 RepID=A0A1X0A9N4_9MYCO|nr:hypothetical protein [Mycobacterium aquaticum]ORA26625.1 hypothetical protein BST13_31685 [Mycobacterium aquaticum]
MYGLAYATITGGALSAFTLGLAAPAVASPSGVGSAQDTMTQLEQDGYQVVVTRQGLGPLERCTVNSVKPLPVVRQTVLLTARC